MLETRGHVDEARRARRSRMDESVLYPRIEWTGSRAWMALRRFDPSVRGEMLCCLLLGVLRQGIEEYGRVGL